jgi:hypothetical protein
MKLLKNLSIGKQLFLSFGFLFLVILILGIFWQRGIVTLRIADQKQNELIELKDKLREMQVIHYKWVDALTVSLNHWKSLIRNSMNQGDW